MYYGPYKIEEAGLSRVATHLRKPFAVISAFRDKYSLKQNRQRNRSLEATMKQYRMGGIKLIGHWQEAPDGMPWKEAKAKGLTEDLVEESFFIPKPENMEYDEFKNIIQFLTYSFNQDASVISDGRNIYLLFKNGSMDKIGSGASFQKIAQAYSQLPNKPRIPFVFEGIWKPLNDLT